MSSSMRAANRDARHAALWLVLCLLAAISVLAAVAAFGQPEPTATPAPVATPTVTEQIDSTTLAIANKGTTWLVNLMGANPRATLLILGAVIFAICFTNGVRLAWPIKRLPTDQPRWATFILGFCDPVVGNFWLLIDWVGRKVGVKPRTPYDPEATAQPPRGGG